MAAETKDDGIKKEAERKTPFGHASAKTATNDDIRHAACNTRGRMGPAGLESKFAVSIEEEAKRSGAEKTSAEASHLAGDTANATDGLSEGPLGMADGTDIVVNSV